MRTWAVFAGSFGGRTKVVSARLNSAAIFCICSPDRPSALRTTPSGLPANCVVVKTSTVTKFRRIVRFSLLRPATSGKLTLEERSRDHTAPMTRGKPRCNPELKRYNAADRFPGVHQVERLVDIGER